MRAIRNFFHNINDIVLAVVIVAIAAGIIFWRLHLILDYPEKMAKDMATYNQETEQATDEAAEGAEQSAEDAATEAAPEEESAEEASAEEASDAQG
jgi:hypothetical protein